MFYFARNFAVVFILFICPHAYACDFPDAVPIPDGTTATEREMAKAGPAIQKYITQLQAYAECIESETGALRKSASKQDISGNKRREEQAAERQNKAAAAIEDAAEKFNKAVDDYKLRAQK